MHFANLSLNTYGCKDAAEWKYTIVKGFCITGSNSWHLAIKIMILVTIANTHKDKKKKKKIEEFIMTIHKQLHESNY